jgi:hypothetical protein
MDLDDYFLSLVRVASDIYRRQWPRMEAVRNLGPDHSPVQMVFCLGLTIESESLEFEAYLKDIAYPSGGVTGLSGDATRKNTETLLTRTIWEGQFQGRGETL